MFNNNYKVVPAFEDVKFSELFTEFREYDKKTFYPDINRHFDDVKGAKIQGWLNFSSRNGYIPALDVKVSDMLAKWVNENMLAIDYDKIYFEIIPFENYFDLYARYNQIIGSRLIARLPVSEMPK